MAQPRKSIQRRFIGLVGRYDVPEPPLIPAAVESFPPSSTKRLGRPPKNDHAMNPAERKAKQRALAPLVYEQKLDDDTGGLYGPGHAAKGGGIEDELAIGEKKHRIDENGEAYIEEARNGRVNSSDVEADAEDDSGPEVKGKSETDWTFQKRRHPKDWKYDERDNQEQAHKLAVGFIESSATADFVFDFGQHRFICVEKLLWCHNCHKVIPAEHRCLICQKPFIFLSDAVEHIVTSIDTKEGDFTHRRAILKNVRQPRSNAEIKNLYDGIPHQAETASASAGWIKADGTWVRK